MRKNMANITRIFWCGGDRNGEDREKISHCPHCLSAEINDVIMELSSLKAEELTDNAGIALRFRDCEFENYQEINPDAARNLAACRRYAENWADVLENGTNLVLTGSCGTGKKSPGGCNGKICHPQLSRQC
ncbi:putative replication protein DnaC [Escherichia coli]|uniref:Putative replication protein DnaC n=1 Tax=Escherichia coli TaxID=562 RepID=A0A376KNK7_ECOLX|nr:putative replication protein DnaC [Escherichia coli]